MKRPSPPASAILVLLVASGSSLAAERPAVPATRAAGVIRVDGVLNEPDWQRAPAITDFRLIFTREGESPSESTDVRVLYDDAHIYFAIRCANLNRGAVRASLTPRDQVLDGDNIVVHLDTYRDFHRAYAFGVNPYGVQLDGVLVGGDVDLNWDGVWNAEARRSPAGWTAEIAVPLRSLRFPDRGSGTWGLWIRRQITKNDEIASWPLWRKAEQGDVMLQAADLTGLETPRGVGAAVELQPYVANTRSEQRSFQGDGTLSQWSRDQNTEAGIDAKAAVTSTLTLNATYNPDYSQVESDVLQIDVNQRFPLYYPEKRPFFFEGAEIFATPFDLVYTRRIADPQYGIKVTGGVGKLRVGGMVVRDEGGGSLEGVGAGPGEGVSGRGWFHVGRLSLNAGDNSTVGVLAAAHLTDADLLDPGPGGTGPRFGADGGANLVLAADANLRLARALFFTGQIAGTRSRFDSTTFVTGSDSIGLAPSTTTTHTRLSDLGYSAALRWADGVRYAEIYQRYLGPEFRNESGFQERVDVRETGFEGDFTVRPENAWLRAWEPNAEVSVIRDHDDVLQEWQAALALDLEFQKQTRCEPRVARVRERWLSRLYDRREYSLGIENSQWRPLAVALEVELGDGIFYGETDAESYLGWQESYDLTATARPSPRLTADLFAKNQRFSRSRGGAEVYDVWALGAKATYQFTRRLYTRVFPQYYTADEHLDLDALLGYVIHPGSVIYLGLGSDVDQREERHRETARSLFLKVSYVFQP